MAIYECKVCSYRYNEEKTGSKWEDLPEDWTCPVCESGKVYFEKIEETQKEEKNEKPKQILKESKSDSIDYLSDFKRSSDDIEKHMGEIHEMAVSGKSIIEAMRTKLDVVPWDDLLIKGAQLFRFPLNRDEEVSTKTIIGKKAKKPLIIDSPVYISHMSFGALSRELKIALAKGSALAKTAIAGGEGGILEDEKNNAYKYIFEYVPNKYSVTDENLKSVDAIEIKIGQGTKPGLGGHLPGEKVTEEIAKVRNKEMNKDIISPSKFEEIKNKDDLKKLVSEIRERSDGRPVGIKIAAGHIKEDMEIAAFAEPDFITIDGRGGGTGASPKFVKDSTSIPTIFALYRAKKYLQENNKDIDLVITGGLRVSSDFVKALALGADAIAVATGALIAAACQQYKVCNKGTCPMGCATQDKDLRKRLHIENSARRVANYLRVLNEELIEFGRLMGYRDIHEVNINDLCTINSEISNHTDIDHV